MPASAATRRRGAPPQTHGSATTLDLPITCTIDKCPCRYTGWRGQPSIVTAPSLRCGAPPHAPLPGPGPGWSASRRPGQGKPDTGGINRLCARVKGVLRYCPLQNQGAHPSWAPCSRGGAQRAQRSALPATLSKLHWRLAPRTPRAKTNATRPPDPHTPLPPRWRARTSPHPHLLLPPSSFEYGHGLTLRTNTREAGARRSRLRRWPSPPWSCVTTTRCSSSA